MIGGGGAGHQRRSVSLSLNIFVAGSSSLCHTEDVAYKLVFDGLAAFVVDITSTSGHQSVRRFPTEVAALMWIAEQEFRDAAADTAEKGADRNQSSASPS